MDDAPRDKRKPVHLASPTPHKGGVSAVCYTRKPRQINESLATWTRERREVTCSACLSVLEIRKRF